MPVSERRGFRLKLLQDLTRGQRSSGSSLAAQQDLPHDQVAALGFDRGGLQLQEGGVRLLRLAILVACRRRRVSGGGFMAPPLTAQSLPTHPEVDVAFSSAHHQHALRSLLTGSVALLWRRIAPAGRRRDCVT